jgi:ubiquitin fusion degradation protein 1
VSHTPETSYSSNDDHSKRLIVSNDTLQDETRVPGPLNLPPGRLFFGYKYVPYKPPPAKETQDPASPTSTAQAFIGAGSSLAGPSRPAQKPTPSTSSQTPKKEATTHSWGAGSSLGNRNQNRKIQAPKKGRSPTPDYGVDSDEDVIEIDSD